MLLFTLNPRPFKTEDFPLHRTRLVEGGPLKYVMRGGTDHGFDTGDIFDVFPDEAAEGPEGKLTIRKVYPQLSEMDPPEGFSLGGNSFARRVKEHPLRIYVHSEDCA